MADMTYSGWETPIFIKVNAACVEYEDVIDAGGNPIQCNGLRMISVAFTAPNTSFAAFITAYPTAVAVVLSMDTGELRYYDGTQAGVATVYIDILADSTGFVSNWEAVQSRAVTSIPEIGSPLPADIKQGVVKYNGRIEKFWSTRYKTTYVAEAGVVPEHPTAVNTSSVAPNLVGFTGWEAIMDAVSATQSRRDGYTPWFMIVAYCRDHSEAATNRGLPIVFPCCRFGGDLSVKSSTDGQCIENLTFEALRAIKAPRDFHQTYTFDLNEQA